MDKRPVLRGVDASGHKCRQGALHSSLIPDAVVNTPLCRVVFPGATAIATGGRLDLSPPGLVFDERERLPAAATDTPRRQAPGPPVVGGRRAALFLSVEPLLGDAATACAGRCRPTSGVC